MNTVFALRSIVNGAALVLVSSTSWAATKVCSWWPDPTTSYDHGAYSALDSSGTRVPQYPSDYTDKAMYNAELFYSALLADPAPGYSSDGDYLAHEMGIVSQKSHWTKYDFGWGSFGDPNKALGRTLNGFGVVWSSYSPAPSNWSDRSGPPIKWVLGYVARVYKELDDFRAGCKPQDGPYATSAHTALTDNYTIVWPAFYFRKNALGRAATLFHEARHHATDESHTNGDSGERRWASPSGGLTIYAWQALYMMSYFYDANINTYKTYRNWAKYHARDLIASKFAELNSIPAEVLNF